MGFRITRNEDNCRFLNLTLLISYPKAPDRGLNFPGFCRRQPLAQEELTYMQMSSAAPLPLIQSGRRRTRITLILTEL